MFWISYILMFFQSLKSTQIEQKDESSSADKQKDENISIVKQNVENISIVKQKGLLYNKNEILAKSDTFKWPRERLLTFLVVQKLISVDFNEKYLFAGEENANIFKEKFDRTINLFKTFLQNAFDKNEWVYGDDKVSKKIKNIEEKLSLYKNNTDFYDLIQKLTIKNASDVPAGKILTDLKASTKEDLKNLEINFLLNQQDDAFYNSLNNILGVKKFYNDLFTHKDYLAICYSELYNFLPNVDMTTVICHDWSKYLISFPIGYTFKFFLINNDENDIIKTWNYMTEENLRDDFFNKAFDVGFRIHFTYENHHPEYYKVPGTKEYHDEKKILRLEQKYNMSDAEGFEESIIDMCGRNMFITVKQSIENFKKGTYIAINAEFLNRYNTDDAEKAVEVILRVIKALNTNEEYERYKTIYDDYILSRRTKDLQVSN